MAEASSRYGILEELNQKKIKTTSELHTLERETNQVVYDTELDLDKKNQIISDKEKTYESEHKNWKKEKQMNIKVLNQDFKRKIESMENDIVKRDSNYKQEHKDWVENLTKEIGIQTKNLDRYKEVQQTKKEDREAIIKQYDENINDLKSMSSEQKTKEE